MAASSSSDIIVLALGVILAAVYLFRDQLFSAGKPKAVPISSSKAAAGNGNPRDFIAKMKESKKRIVIFYGSQTGTAEEYAIRLAKEAKSKFGLASLVCDPEEYDFENLDQIPEDCCVFFVMATYGEGEPTDNAVQLCQNLSDESFEFSNGEHKLSGLKYVAFGLGNKTYEHYNLISRNVDRDLAKMGAIRIGERGEGDDDKSMEEDYLEWKDGMWEAFAQAMNVEEGQGGDSPDFAVTEVAEHPPEKVYLGELSARALTRTKGIHDAKNPYPAPITVARELFQIGADRNCVHIELSTEGSGITYQHGDHVGVWPSNAEVEVDRLLCALGLYDKRDTVINIESLDPALAKVPFPVPTTYGTVLRHYIDISALAGRQILGVLSKFAPNPEAETIMKDLNTNKDHYQATVAHGCMKLGEVLQYAAANDLSAKPTPETTTAWKIPFDIIVSSIPRLQPRYYSISSSPKLHPNSIHVTAVVLKYESEPVDRVQNRWVYGVGSNFLLNLKYATNHESAPLISDDAKLEPALVEVPSYPTYAIEGPRGAYKQENILKAPIHVRRSTFRLPTNPKSPVIMIGPGTGVAPFRGFVQERVAMARRTIEMNGPEGLADWGPIRLYFGCRRSDQDFLYKDEWDSYAKELQGKFIMRNAFSREPPYKPDGGKVYVQDLIWEDQEHIADTIINGKGYIYICGDAKGRPQAGIIVEPHSSHIVDTSDEAGIIVFRNKIWPIVEEEAHNTSAGNSGMLAHRAMSSTVTDSSDSLSFSSHSPPSSSDLHVPIDLKLNIRLPRARTDSNASASASTTSLASTYSQQSNSTASSSSTVPRPLHLPQTAGMKHSGLSFSRHTPSGLNTTVSTNSDISDKYQRLRTFSNPHSALRTPTSTTYHTPSRSPSSGVIPAGSSPTLRQRQIPAGARPRPRTGTGMMYRTSSNSYASFHESATRMRGSSAISAGSAAPF